MANPRTSDPAETTPKVVLAPIQAHRTFEMVIKHILNAVDAGGLSEGDRLPKETDMAEMLEVSRPTLRQALSVLIAAGVLRSRAGKAGGVFVASAMIPLDILQQHIEQEVDQITELMQTRRLLEPIVVHLTIEHAANADLDRVEKTIFLMKKHINDPRKVQQADGMSHRRLSHAAGNQILINAISDVYQKLVPLRDVIHTTESVAHRMIDLHTRQLEAIRQRDHQLLDSVLGESYLALESEFGVSARYGLRWVSLREDCQDPPPRASAIADGCH